MKCEIWSFIVLTSRKWIRSLVKKCFAFFRLPLKTTVFKDGFCFLILSDTLFSQLYCTLFVFPKCYWCEILPSFKILFVSAFQTYLLDSSTNGYLSLSSSFIVSELAWLARDFSWKCIWWIYNEVLLDLITAVSPVLQLQKAM